ncbi:outer membrane beta-barrel protein [Marinobacter sp. CHS3-4]|uniref:outer membrane beta-barrel protein n=1 Tax=Marinobacter sp. CHS3-4 TaxID=3045174 RepID=UPI0024B4C464|nr:outer membrane beta-barrel protein [Marinobacter sp. CHS3-4]MDI9246909.1 outer membrane beta-barrel protein [Marinobacter sp. CHS3-4]
MNSLLRLSLAVALVPAALLMSPQAVNAQEEMREGRTYIGLIGTRLNHRTVDDGDIGGQAWSSMTSLQLGTHISENWHVELRTGTGVASGKVDNELEVDIDYYVSWYIGGNYPITDYSNIYAQFGFSHIKGESKLTPFGRFRAETPQTELPEELKGPTYKDLADMRYPESSFSTSWLVGVDIEVVDDSFLFFEIGKFFEDTETKANVFQYNGGLKYEF